MFLEMCSVLLLAKWKSVGVIVGVDCGVSGMHVCRLECVLLHVEDKL